MDESPKNSAIMLAAFGVATLLNLAFNISMGWMLSVSDYGVLALFTAVAFILMMFVSSGFPPAIAKLLSERRYIENSDKSRERLVLAMVGNLSLGILLSLLAYVVYCVYYVADGYYRELIYVLILLVVVASVGWVLRGALQGLFRFKELSSIQVLEPALKLTIAVLLVWFGLGVRGAIYAILLSSVLVTGVSMTLFRQMGLVSWALGRLGSVRTLTLPLRRVLATDLFVYSPPIFLGLFGITILLNIDVVSLKLLGGEGANVNIGLYQAAIVIGKMPYFLSSVVLNVMFPYISHYALEGELMAQYARRTMKYLLVFLIPLPLIMLLVPSEVITLIYPHVYMQGARALRVYALASMCVVVGLGFMRILQAAGRPVRPALAMLAALVVDGVLLCLLVPAFSIVGAALSTLGAALCFLVLCAAAFSRAIPMGVGRRAAHYVASLLILCVMVLVLPHGSRLALVGDVVVSYVVYVLLLIWTGVLDRMDVEVVGSSVGERGRALALSVFERVKPQG
ncbi:MAG: oligosaccharide flippase family protein [Methermicoccaceae archaeon]